MGSATQFRERALGLPYQGLHVRARRHREQDVRSLHPAVGDEALRMGFVVTPALVVARLGHADLALQQLLDDGVGITASFHAHFGGACQQQIADRRDRIGCDRLHGFVPRSHCWRVRTTWYGRSA